MPAYVPTAEEVCMASKVCTQYFCLSPCLSHQTILTQCDMVLLEVVEGQLLLKDQMREYMDHGDFLESWLYLDFFLGMYDGKTLKDTTVSCG